MRVFVTGGSGMIGRPLIKLLISEGFYVDNYDVIKSRMQGVSAEYSNIELLQMAEPYDYGILLAGMKGGVGIGRKSAFDFMYGNIMPTLLAMCNLPNRVKKIVYVSSVGAYSDAEIFTENNAWVGEPHQADKYGGWAKRIGELLCEALYTQYKIEYVIVRPTNVYGPGDAFSTEKSMVVGALIKKFFTQDRVEIWGDGSAKRDFLYSGDCANGILQALSNGKNGEIYNLGSGYTVTIKMLVDMITEKAKAYGKTPEIVFDKSKPSGNKIRLMDIKKSMCELYWEPFTTLSTGLNETIKDYMERERRF